MELGNLLFGNSRGTYAVERDNWEAAFNKFLEDAGFDSYGFVPQWANATLKTHKTEFGGYENEVFRIQPYYWGENPEIACLPNFVFKKTGYSLQWYKYPLRDAYANQDISYEEFVEMLNTCLKSIGD